MSNEDYYLYDAAAVIEDALKSLPGDRTLHLDNEDELGDAAWEIATALDRECKFIQGYRNNWS